jgi:hypothetical protein
MAHGNSETAGRTTLTGTIRRHWIAPGGCRVRRRVGLAPGVGLEPTTYRVTTDCSAQLSYPGPLQADFVSRDAGCQLSKASDPPSTSA